MKKRYSDLENLLFKGFIPLKLKIANVNFVFKNLNEIEYERVAMMSGIKEDSQYIANFHANYLFYSIYMVDGMNMLSRREEFYEDFFSTIKSFPTVFFKIVFNHLEKLVQKSTECSKLVEAYSYENESRFNWECRKSLPLNSTLYTGIEGTEKLGLNQFQNYWTVLNKREDSKDKFETEYSMFKFLASFTDSKTVKKIDAQDKAKKDDENNRREKIKREGTDYKPNVEYVNKADDGTDAILEELERQILGKDKDDHDKIIEEYESGLRKNMLLQMQELKRIKEERRKQLENFGEQARPISPEELAERMARFRDRNSKPVTSRFFDNDTSGKFLQMSNVKDEDIIEKEKMMENSDYENLMEDEMFRGLSNNRKSKYKSKIQAEQEYDKQQKTLADKFGNDNLDFPHLNKDR